MQPVPPACHCPEHLMHLAGCECVDARVSGASLFGPENASIFEKYLVKTLCTDIVNAIVAGKRFKNMYAEIVMYTAKPCAHLHDLFSLRHTLSRKRSLILTVVRTNTI